MGPIKFTIEGQCTSGKNSVIITRSGMRFPSKRFVTWRNEAMKNIPQIKKPIDESVEVVVQYYSGDKRRRDVPGMVDALWHVIEKAGIVTDDKHLGGIGAGIVFRSHYDKAHPRIEITISQREDGLNDSCNAQKVSRKGRTQQKRKNRKEGRQRRKKPMA